MAALPSTTERLQSRLDRLGRAIEFVIVAVASALLVALAVVLFLQVLFRYGLQAPLSWSEEVARLILVWFSVLAAAAGARSGQHFVFRWLTMTLPERPRFWCRQIATAITLAILGVVIVQGTSYLAVVAGQTSVMTKVDMRIPYAGIPIGLGLFFVLYLFDLLDGILSVRTGRCLSPREAREAAVHVQIKSSGPIETTAPTP